MTVSLYQKYGSKTKELSPIQKMDEEVSTIMDSKIEELIKEIEKIKRSKKEEPCKGTLRRIKKETN